MTKRMLIDATHPEEVRVVVLNGNRLEEFDFETSTKKQNKGNIYLAKITRVEPSLQAAFVEYGGNRHGFLAFNEIHPDYYQIPIADREALAAQEATLASEVEAADSAAADAQAAIDDDTASVSPGSSVQVVSGDEIDQIARRRSYPSRRYRMQEVIKRRQIMLVQVVKEERGTKGAALTTYISLAGRYCVLMPNTGRGGGISRKIVNPEDRKRLKAIAADLPVPQGIGVILRTAGMGRSKAEIKRDFNYLLKLWDDIRENTLKSVAPAMIHEEAGLINRAIRDLYSKDIEEVLVDGDEGYRTAKQVMRTLTPSHAKRVTLYNDRIPLFHRFQVEGQFDAMHSPTVQLKSGGYIVINPTEALVAIDVNSGRATRERNIEETAYKTNLEAAEEVSRQLRLRDLSGLIVVDFIDMDEPKNVRTVERRFKESMKNDRARIQMGHISAFGLLELSRQRLRPSLLEVSSLVCSHCGGTGHVRSTESAALNVLRAIEEEGIRARSSEIAVFVPSAVVLYIFNQKRADLNAIEERYNFRVRIDSDDSLISSEYRLERVRTHAGDEKTADAEVAAEPDKNGSHKEEKTDSKRRRTKQPRGEDAAPQQAGETGGDESVQVTESTETTETTATADVNAGDGTEISSDEPRKRRRRGKRGGRRHRATDSTQGSPAADADQGQPPESTPTEEPDAARAEAGTATAGSTDMAADESPAEVTPTIEDRTAAEDKAAKPKRARRSRRKKSDAEASPDTAASNEIKAARPPRARRSRRKKSDDEPEVRSDPSAAPMPPEPIGIAAAPTNGGEAPSKRPAQPSHVPAAEEPTTVPDVNQPGGGPRRGWWQRLMG